jgi:hypothetical protein
MEGMCSRVTHNNVTVPYRITTSNNKDIVVVDMTSPDTGRVVVVGREGDLRWTYTPSTQPTHNCPLMSMSSEKGYLMPKSRITFKHVNISPCPDKTWRTCLL